MGRTGMTVTMLSSVTIDKCSGTPMHRPQGLKRHTQRSLVHKRLVSGGQVSVGLVFVFLQVPTRPTLTDRLLLSSTNTFLSPQKPRPHQNKDPTFPAHDGKPTTLPRRTYIPCVPAFFHSLRVPPGQRLRLRARGRRRRHFLPEGRLRRHPLLRRPTTAAVGEGALLG